MGGRARAPSGAATARWLICVELQRDHATSRTGELSIQLENCRALLEHARHAGWAVIHVHMRRDAPDAGAIQASARPIAGFEPLPSEAVFFRDGGPNSVDHPFWRLTHGAEGVEAMVIGFIDDRTCAGGVASLSRTGVAVTLVEDAVGGGYARTHIERRVGAALTRDVIRVAEPQDRRPHWLQAANAP